MKGGTQVCVEVVFGTSAWVLFISREGGRMTIKVIDTIRLAAQMLGVDEELNAYEIGDDTETGERVFKKLLQCFQTVENEIALDYIPLTEELEIVTATGIVGYANFHHSPASILSVEDGEGNSLRYHIYSDHIYVENARGKARIIYSYAPSEKTEEGVSEHTLPVSKRLIAYGMAAEYSLAMGELTAANAWSVKYKEALRAAQKLPAPKRIESRRWV